MEAFYTILLGVIASLIASIIAFYFQKYVRPVKINSKEVLGWLSLILGGVVSVIIFWASAKFWFGIDIENVNAAWHNWNFVIVVLYVLILVFIPIACFAFIAFMLFDFIFGKVFYRKSSIHFGFVAVGMILFFIGFCTGVWGLRLLSNT